MKKYLLIVESPHKAETIEKFFKGKFKVLASGGHVRDLPQNGDGYVVEDGKFEPIFEISGKDGKEKERKKKILNQIKRAASNTNVFLASDPDREGEAIAWHLAQVLKLDLNEKVRIRFNEITPDALKKSLDNPDYIDLNKVNAQLARRLLDRIVGYKISPMLWRIFKSNLSAGRVQSAALKLIIDLEKKRAIFKPQEYWSIDADFNFNGNILNFALHSFEGKIIRDKDIKNVKQADYIESKSLLTKEYKVLKVDKKISYSRPPYPYITSTLQQDASKFLGFYPEKTMKIAQKLYEGIDISGEKVALITYMRTDSTRLSDESKKKAKSYILDKFGLDFIGTYKSKNSSNSQDAHEAIRPIYPIKYTPQSLKNKIDSDYYKLYSLIWQRFIASQMKSASYNITTVIIDNGDVKYKIKGKEEIFKGYKVIYDKEFKSSSDEKSFQNIPSDLKEGEFLHIQNIKKEQKYTKPPARYTVSSLIKTLEKNGVGRPSTYASIIRTLKDRKYIVLKGSTRSKSVFPTVIGYLVNLFLESSFQDIIKIKFTAFMEEQLDLIESGVIDKDKMLKEFMEKFEKDIKHSKESFKNIIIDIPTNLTCECGGDFKLKIGKYGLYAKCDKCGKTKTIPKKLSILYTDGKADIKDLDTTDKLDETCPKCGAPLVYRIGRYGKFIGCSNYPKCNYIKPYEEIVGKCPDCGGDVIKLRSKKGKTYYKCKSCEKVFFKMKDFLPLEV
jgi:DNA topoisomerase-1